MTAIFYASVAVFGLFIVGGIIWAVARRMPSPQGRHARRRDSGWTPEPVAEDWGEDTPTVDWLEDLRQQAKDEAAVVHRRWAELKVRAYVVGALVRSGHRARAAWAEPQPAARRQLPARHAPGPALPPKAETEAAVVLAEVKAEAARNRAAEPPSSWPGEFETGSFAAIGAGE